MAAAAAPAAAGGTAAVAGFAYPPNKRTRAVLAGTVCLPTCPACCCAQAGQGPVPSSTSVLDAVVARFLDEQLLKAVSLVNMDRKQVRVCGGGGVCGVGGQLPTCTTVVESGFALRMCLDRWCQSSAGKGVKLPQLESGLSCAL